MFNCCKNLDFTYTPLEWINDNINAISYYSVLRNATAHMHRKDVFNKEYMYKNITKYI